MSAVPIMKATLVALDGPVRGETFSLEEDEVGIGRAPDNGIVVEDASVSRRHCVIRRAPQGLWVVRDLESRNGTFINGLPVTERVLEDRDELRVGRCLFTFHIDGDEAASRAFVQFDRENTETRALGQLRREETMCLHPQALSTNPAIAARLGRGFLTLLRISAALHTARRMDELCSQLLRLTLEAIPAERGAILLTAGGEELAVAYVWHRESGAGGTLQASLPIVRQCLREGVTVLSGAAPQESSAAPARLLAAPIFCLDREIGVIYLESTDLRVRFGEEHLHLAAAIGGIAGMAIDTVSRLERLEAENQRLRHEINIEHDMVGVSPRMREVYDFIAKVARTESTVLLRGESGTGKELVARAIHRNSLRAAGPFVAINCATLTETLLESELFGHEKGAFTGAVALHKGKIEAAAGGTIFLDEAGELPFSIQAKLLRVLQEREFERVGGNRPIRADIRLIAATNRDLEAAVANGTFRRDLYYRLNVLPLALPALRERREDIAPLASHFAAKHSVCCKRSVPEISPEALRCLFAYDWPGNVRELENAIEHAIVLGSSSVILAEDLPEAVFETASAASGVGGAYQRAVYQHKERLILDALDQAGGVFTEAAKLLGMQPNYLHRLVRNLNLRSAIKKSSTNG